MPEQKWFRVEWSSVCGRGMHYEDVHAANSDDATRKFMEQNRSASSCMVIREYKPNEPLLGNW